MKTMNGAKRAAGGLGGSRGEEGLRGCLLLSIRRIINYNR